MKTYGVILIGCGVMGELHLAEGIIPNKQIRLVGVVDIKSNRAREYAKRFGAESWSVDYKEYLKREDVDIIIITTLPSSHGRIAIDSLKAGKHVLCEKPFTPALEEAKMVIGAARETGRKLRVGYILRFNESYRRVKELIDKNYLGSPLIMRMLGAEHTITKQGREQDLALIRETSPIIDCGCHYVDVMRWFTGSEAVSVSGVGVNIDPKVEKTKNNYEIINVKLKDGSAGIYEVGWGTTFREFSVKEFIGPKGRIRLIYQTERIEHKEEGDLIEYYRYPDHYQQINVKGKLKQMGVEIQDLIDYIEEDKDPLPDLENVLKSMEIVLAGDKAIKTGRAVTIGRRN